MMVTDIVFRESSVENIFLKKWSVLIIGHIISDLLVLCLKFRLSLVSEYLNYYYKIANGYWAIPEKTRFEDILCWKKYLKFLGLLLCTWKLWTKQSFPLANSMNCVTPLGNSKAKNEDFWKFNMIFSWSFQEIPLLFQLTPGISIWFLKMPCPLDYVAWKPPRKFVWEIKKEFVLECAKLILQNSNMKFRDKFYNQIKVTAVGTILAPTLQLYWWDILKSNFIVPAL